MGGRPGTYGVVDLYVRMSELAPWVEATRAAAAGKPPVPVDVVELDEGFPLGQRGELAQAFFDAFEVGEERAWTEFAEAYRSPAAQRRNPTRAFVQRLAELHSELGALSPVRLARISEGKWAVLAEAREHGWRAVYFRFDVGDEGALLADFGVRDEDSPGEGR